MAEGSASSYQMIYLRARQANKQAREESRFCGRGQTNDNLPKQPSVWKMSQALPQVQNS